jgi:site-specific DNA-methyltransferase (adenine-specific)
MGKKWDNTGDFYQWNKQRASQLHRIMKPGAYAAIFGHPKTNHRMKCAFEDSGFRIVEEIDWIYLNGMPKSQSVSNMFVEAASESAKRLDGYKTAGLKPTHETITIFQKPLDGTYVQNIEKWNCGAFNIEACRVPFQSGDDHNAVKAKCNFTEASNETRGTSPHGIYNFQKVLELEESKKVNPQGRFPANIILDESAAQCLDEQTPGNGSKIFAIIKYNPKVSPSERKLPNGERNPPYHVKTRRTYQMVNKTADPAKWTHHRHNRRKLYPRRSLRNPKP